MEKNYQIEKVKFERDDFLVDVILQNNATKEVLFGASMSEETLRETIEKGLVVLYSKSRKTRWFKGETSGDYLQVVKIAINCERNQLLIQVIPLGKGVCHERDEDGMAKSTCFSRTFFEVLI